MFNRFNHNMNSKVDTNVYFFLIVLLALLVGYLQPKLIVPALLIVAEPIILAAVILSTKRFFSAAI